EAWFIAFVALAVGLLTIFSMTKIWGEAFWKPHPDGVEPVMGTLDRSVIWPLVLPIAGLATLTIIIGLNPEPFVQFAERSADQLLNPEAYVRAVLGGAP
ncbi:MAG: Na+/H+ antiporter subunit D, partial [Pseudomonadota bacterium]